MATNPDGTALPPVRVDAAARQRIRASLSTTGRRIAGLDDDPTDSQRCTRWPSSRCSTQWPCAPRCHELTDEVRALLGIDRRKGVSG